MTPDRPGDIQVKQEFRIQKMIEAVGGYMDTRRSLSELIDNALDETPGNECSEILITFDPNTRTPHSPGVVFQHSNTTGMSAIKMQEFSIWGDTHEDQNKLKQWGWGGKLALLHWLDKENGSIDITSRQRQSTNVTKMTIENWWKRLLPNEVFQTETQSSSYEPKGFTRFELRGTKKDVIPSQVQLVDIANNLGLVYGKLIKGNRLKLTLRRFSNNGSINSIDVEPIVPIFDKDRSDSKPISIKSGNETIRMEITWGLLDIEERNKDTKKRAAIYNTDPSKIEITTGGVYLYNHNRFLTTIPLSEFRIARTSTGSLQSFAATVNVYHGFVAQNLLKTGLSLPTNTSADLMRKIKKEIEPHALEIARQADPTISNREKKNIEEIEKKFKVILEKLFKNNREIAEAIHIVKVENGSIPYSSSGVVNPEKKNGDGDDSLRVPGLRSSPSQNKPRESRTREALPANPVPKFEINTSFPDEYPSALFTINSTGDSVILFNRKHPAVKHALETRNISSTSLLLYMAARCFYHQKWAVDSQGNPQVYANGIEKDVAFFLRAAEGLNLF